MKAIPNDGATNSLRHASYEPLNNIINRIDEMYRKTQLGMVELGDTACRIIRVSRSYLLDIWSVTIQDILESWGVLAESRVSMKEFIRSHDGRAIPGFTIYLLNIMSVLFGVKLPVESIPICRINTNRLPRRALAALVRTNSLLSQGQYPFELLDILKKLNRSYAVGFDCAPMALFSKSMIRDETEKIVNLFISCVVFCARRQLCHDLGILYESLPMQANGAFNTAGFAATAAARNQVLPAWWANHSDLLNGDGVIARFRWERVCLNETSSDIEIPVAPLAARPAWIDWSWDDTMRCLDANSACNCTYMDSRHVCWTPYVDLSVVPFEIRARLRYHSSVNDNGGAKMRLISWYRIISDKPITAEIIRSYNDRDWDIPVIPQRLTRSQTKKAADQDLNA